MRAFPRKSIFFILHFSFFNEIYFQLPTRQGGDQGEIIVFLKDGFHCAAFAIDEDKTDLPVPDFQPFEDLGDGSLLRNFERFQLRPLVQALQRADGFDMNNQVKCLKFKVPRVPKVEKHSPKWVRLDPKIQH